MRKILFSFLAVQLIFSWSKIRIREERPSVKDEEKMSKEAQMFLLSSSLDPYPPFASWDSDNGSSLSLSHFAFMAGTNLPGGGGGGGSIQIIRMQNAEDI
jgi:hypothetical protein